MPPFLYRCPITGYKVHGFVTEEVSEDSEDYEAVRCHPINPTTGKVLGAEDD